MTALHLGDCLDVLRTIPSQSIDAVVTDPPYGLSFLGKKWDYDVPSVEIWQECLRVLKSGGHLLAFAGTRTQHRMAVRIEDAGFDIRDMIAWVYGSGFPKSLDVSKAMDKLREDGTPVTGNSDPEVLRFTQWLRSTGITRQQIREATGTTMDSHYLSSGSQPAIPTKAHWAAIRPLIEVEIPEWAERAAERAALLNRREVVGVGSSSLIRGGTFAIRSVELGNLGAAQSYMVTAPATEAARQWQGWGTSLKPALEPITVARKPITGTVAENVLKHGTGAINVDASRIDGDRWPANFIHDGSKEATRLLGDAHRFFYSAKAGNEERTDDNNHPTVKPTDLMRYLCRLVTPPNGIVLDPFMGSGSTGVAAILEGFRFVGIEREPHYHQIATKRIDRATAKPKQSRLF